MPLQGKKRTAQAKAKARGQGQAHMRDMGQQINQLEKQIHVMRLRPNTKQVSRMPARRDPKRDHLAKLSRYCSFNGSPVPRLMPDGQALYQPDAMIKDFSTFVYDTTVGTSSHSFPVRSLLITSNFGVTNTIGFLIQWQTGAVGGQNTGVYAMPITCLRIPSDVTTGSAPSSGVADTVTVALQNTTANRFIQGPVSVAALASRIDSDANPSTWPITTWDALFDTWRTLPQPGAVRMNAQDFRSAKSTWSFPRDNVLYNSYEKYVGNYGGPAWSTPLNVTDADPGYPTLGLKVGDRLNSFFNHIVTDTSSQTTSNNTVVNRLPMSYTAIMIEQIGPSTEMTDAQGEKQQSYTATCTGTWLFRYPQNNPLNSMQKNVPTETAHKIIQQRDAMEQAGATVAIAAGAAIVAGGIGLLTGGPAGAIAGAEAGFEFGVELTEPLLGGAAAMPAALPAEAGLGGAMARNFAATPEQWAPPFPPPPRRRMGRMGPRRY